MKLIYTVKYYIKAEKSSYPPCILTALVEANSHYEAETICKSKYKNIVVCDSMSICSRENILTSDGLNLPT